MKKYFLFFLFLCGGVHLCKAQGPYNTAEWDTLKKTLVPYSIIGLGETGHGYETLNESKMMFAGFLEEKLSYHAILFESSFTLSVIAYLEQPVIDKRMEGFIYAFWKVPSVKKGLEDFYLHEKDHSFPAIAGFDVQEDCRYIELSRYLVNRQLVKKNREALHICDSILSTLIGTRAHAKTMSQRTLDAYNDYMDQVMNEVKEQNLPGIEGLLIMRSLQNRKWLGEYLSFSDVNEKMHFRDSLMASNITWMKKEIYPEQKIILWAANLHISKPSGKKSAPWWMGEYISAAFPGSYYAIGFQKGNKPKALHLTGTAMLAINTIKTGFDATVYFKKLVKIKPEEWMLGCPD